MDIIHIYTVWTFPIKFPSGRREGACIEILKSEAMFISLPSFGHRVLVNIYFCRGSRSNSCFQKR